jgi:Ca2+-transporting ATPase
MSQKVHHQQIDQILKNYGTDKEKGLSRPEVKKLQEQYGENALVAKKKRTILAMIIDQFKDYMIAILILAAVISMITHDPHEGFPIEGIIILGIVILNAVLGVYQENRASNALDALKSMAAPKAKVIREGNITSISSKEVVPGDVVVLEAGDYVPADIRLIESVNLKIDESALTGESVAVEKDADAQIDEEAALGDRVNCAFMSTIVTYGRGRGIVTGTGMDTEIGHIADMLNETEETKTPLQEKLAQFGKMLAIVVLVVAAIIFALGIIRGENPLDIFMVAVSLAVAAIPEGLPAVVTVVLAMGMQRMIKRNAIMKRLSAVETLGSTSTICTDKTGTLTQNKMTVLKVFNGRDEWDVSGTGYGFEGDIVNDNGHDKIELDMLFKVAVLCNDAEIEDQDVIGDPTEGALIVLGAKGDMDKLELNTRYPRVKEFPFDSDRKLMSTLHHIEGKAVMLTKGAPDVILNRATKIILDGKEEELTDYMRDMITNRNADYAEQAMRVLGYAYKYVSDDADLQQEEEELVFAGLSGMIDPPREEAKAAVALCKKAGIRVVMITGDHITTASAIAKEIGVLDEQSHAMEGARINDYTDEEFREIVKTTNVFARVSPEHKVKIVTAIRENGDVAAMTGDGVNDAPALKKADIGIAMGITGTDVSKEAADMILTDDNFASIVDAVEEGRIIYSNIRKFVGFLLSCNIGEILIIFLAILFNWPVPLLPIQLLWVNLITDSFPAFALGLEEGEKGIMEQKPRDKNEPIVDRSMSIAIVLQSIGLTVAVLGSFVLGYFVIGDGVSAESETLARTFCFITLIVGEMLRAYSARSESKAIWDMKMFSNSYLNYSVLGALALLFVVIYTPPLAAIFGTVGLELGYLAMAIGLGIIPTIFGEIAKKVSARA